AADQARGAGIGAAGWRLRQPEQPAAVADQYFLKRRLGNLPGRQLLQTPLRLDEGVIAAEQELVLQSALHVSQYLARNVARRPARDVDVDVRLVQRHRQQLDVPRIPKVRRDHVEVWK